MKVYLCEKCQRIYKSPVPVKNITCLGKDGIEHKATFMEEVNDESK